MAYTPIEYTRQGNEIIIPDIEGEKKVSLTKLFAEAPDGAVIRFGRGRFSTEAGYEINRSLTLLGDPEGKTVIGGKNKKWILGVSAGNVTFENIEVINLGALPTHKVVVTGGKFTARNCSFTDGARFEGQTDGHGLKILGDAEFDVSDCTFFDHPGCGCYIHGDAKGVFSRNQLANADTCLSIGENAVVHVDSCQISSAKAGIGLADESVSIVENCDITDVRGGILVLSPKENVIRNNRISAVLGCVNVFQEGHAQIIENICQDAQIGIFCKEQASAEIRGNELSQNELGIDCQGNTHDILIEGNKAHHNSKAGIALEGNSVYMVINNEVTQNENIGIFVLEDSDGIIEGNTITNNGGIGIKIEGAANARVQRNQLEDNGWRILNQSSGKVEVDENYPPVFIAVELEPTWDGNKWVVGPPKKNALIDPTHLADNIENGQTLFFVAGTYAFHQVWKLKKPIRMACDGVGSVKIVGKGDTILNYSGRGELTIENLAFVASSSPITTGIKASSGTLNLLNIEVTGAHDPKHSKHADGAGVVVTGKANLKMTGCKLHDNELGVSILDEAKADIRDCVIRDNLYGVICRDMTKSTIEKNEFSGHKAFGVMCYDQSDVRIFANHCHHNEGAGIGVNNDSFVVIEHNTCDNNDWHGIFADHNGGVTIRYNMCSENGKSGISICGTLTANVSENECHSNAENGIDAFEQACPFISRNKLHHNSTGVLLGDDSHTEVLYNECFENTGAGIQLRDSAVSEIRENHVHHNGGEGIDDSSFEDETVIEENVLEYNGGGDSDEDSDDDGESINLNGLSGFSLGSDDDDEEDEVDEATLMNYIRNSFLSQAANGNSTIAIPLGGVNLDSLLNQLREGDDDEEEEEEDVE